MTTGDRVLLWISATICALAIIFAFGALTIPSFRTDGALIAGTILGALTTLAATIAGVSYARNVSGGTEGKPGGPSPPPPPGDDGRATTEPNRETR